MQNLNGFFVITRDEVEDEITVCPYCLDEKTVEKGCCGESNLHFETAYVVGGEVYLSTEVIFTKRPYQGSLFPHHL